MEHKVLSNYSRMILAVGKISVTFAFLKRIEQILPRKLGIPESSVTYICYPGGKEYHSYEELIDCDNSLEKRIRSLDIVFQSNSEKDLTIYLTLGKQDRIDRLWYSVTGRIAGEENLVNEAYQELDYEIRKIKRGIGYEIFALFLPVMIPIGFVLSFSFFNSWDELNYFSAPLFGILPIPYSELPEWMTLFRSISIIFLSTSTSGCLYLVIRRIASKNQFLFGDGMDSHQRIAALRKRILWDFVIAIIVSVAGGVIVEWIIPFVIAFIFSH